MLVEHGIVKVNDNGGVNVYVAVDVKGGVNVNVKVKVDVKHVV